MYFMRNKGQYLNIAKKILSNALVKLQYSLNQFKDDKRDSIFLLREMRSVQAKHATTPLQVFNNHALMNTALQIFAMNIFVMNKF